MIEVMPAMPGGVTGIRVSRRLSGEDLRLFEPMMKQLRYSDGIRVVEVIASDYEGFGPGGLMEDLKIGLGFVAQQRHAFRRFAIVTDQQWVVDTLHALAWMIPGDMKILRLDDLDGAVEWAAA